MAKTSARKKAYDTKYTKAYRKKHPNYNRDLMRKRRKLFPGGKGQNNGAGPGGRGKDISHKGGRLAVESRKTNRARAGRKTKKS